MTKKAENKKVKISNEDNDAARAVQVATLSFEEAMGDLEQMIERIESGAVGLEESLQEYERGIELFRHCRSILNQAEQRFEKLRLMETNDTAGGSSANQE